MAHSSPALLKHGSHLGDRILWFDGSMTVEPSSLLEFMRPNTELFVTAVTPDVASYNLLADRPIGVKSILDISTIRPEDWEIPTNYLNMDLDEFFDQKLNEWSGLERERRALRVQQELAGFRRIEQEIVLKLMVYIVDTLIEHDCVWGIGRGSSVSCFLLYLIGVHDIDSVEFDLSFTDFIKSA